MWNIWNFEKNNMWNMEGFIAEGLERSTPTWGSWVQVWELARDARDQTLVRKMGHLVEEKVSTLYYCTQAIMGLKPAQTTINIEWFAKITWIKIVLPAREMEQVHLSPRLTWECNCCARQIQLFEELSPYPSSVHCGPIQRFIRFPSLCWVKG